MSNWLLTIPQQVAEMNKIINAARDVANFLTPDVIYFNNKAAGPSTGASGISKQALCLFNSLIYYQGRISNLRRTVWTSMSTEQKSLAVYRFLRSWTVRMLLRQCLWLLWCFSPALCLTSMQLSFSSFTEDLRQGVWQSKGQWWVRQWALDSLLLPLDLLLLRAAPHAG